MSYPRIRAVLAVLAAGVAAVRLLRRLSRVQRELTAERAGRRLLDHVVDADHQVRVENLERRLSNLAAAVHVPADPTPTPPTPSACSSDPKEGGHS